MQEECDDSDDGQDIAADAIGSRAAQPMSPTRGNEPNKRWLCERDASRASGWHCAKVLAFLIETSNVCLGPLKKMA